MEQGFVDLRSGDEVVNDNASFWPSFTDIMMVVVMIFMLASIVLIVRNWELVAELRNTMEAERQAAEMARTASETNATLEEQLAHAQSQLSGLRMQLMQAEEAAALKSQMLDEKGRRITALEAQRTEQQENITLLTRQRNELAQNLAMWLTTIDALQGRNTLLLTELDGVRQRVDRQQVELERLRRDGEQGAARLTLLQGEYDQLKVRYDKLVKPARSAKGKRVVEVRYEKVTGKAVIRLKDMGDERFRSFERKALEEYLDGVKKRHPRQLYIKIIIPDNSGLSYNEAWSFTKALLERYDYYYQ